MLCMCLILNEILILTFLDDKTRIINFYERELKLCMFFNELKYRSMRKKNYNPIRDFKQHVWRRIIRHNESKKGCHRFNNCNATFYRSAILFLCFVKVTFLRRIMELRKQSRFEILFLEFMKFNVARAFCLATQKLLFWKCGDTFK